MKKIHHFIVPFVVSGSAVEASDPAVVHQLKNVLRLQPGERICLADGQGNKVAAEITAFTAGSVQGAVTNRWSAPRAVPAVALYLSLLKRDTFEWAVEKVVELGVETIVPLATERTIKHGLNDDRLGKIIREAAEQSEQFFVPAIQPVQRLDAALKNAAQSGRVYFCCPEGEPHTAVGLPSNSDRHIFIGPEGGWTEAELETAGQHGAALVNLGKSILRAETAAVVSVFWARGGRSMLEQS